MTFWESVADETIYAPIADVARLSLHKLTAPEGLVLPELRPFGNMNEAIPDFPGLRPADARYLQDRIEWARSAFVALHYQLPRGLIHGDANVGNILCDSAGTAVLLDLDSFAIGPREWDLFRSLVAAITGAEVGVESTAVARSTL